MYTMKLGEGGEFGPRPRVPYKAPNVIPLHLRVYSNPPCRSSNGVYRYSHDLDKDGCCFFCSYVEIE